MYCGIVTFALKSLKDRMSRIYHNFQNTGGYGFLWIHILNCERNVVNVAESCGEKVNCLTKFYFIEFHHLDFLTFWNGKVCIESIT